MFMEKRQFTRIELTTSVRSTVCIGNITFNGFVDNLSIKGMMFKSSYQIPLNEIMSITIFPSEDNSDIQLKTEGKAVRNVNAGVGVCFNKPEHDLFEKFIKIALLKMSI